jgi:hypothetical protein
VSALAQVRGGDDDRADGESEDRRGGGVGEPPADAAGHVVHVLLEVVDRAVLAVALTGCKYPYPRGQPAPATSRSTQHADDQQSSLSGVVTTSARPSSVSARQTAELFARSWVNWDWRSAAEQQRALARLATGTLAGRLQANADSARINASLARDKPGSRGSIAAVDLIAHGSGAAGIVVAREQTYTDRHAGRGGRHFRVYRNRSPSPALAPP